jgi:hypothetical protein
MRFDVRHHVTGNTDVASPKPRRDGLGAALRRIWGRPGEALPDDFESQLAELDAVTRQPRHNGG